MKFESKRLSQIKGITEKKAEEISQSFNENWELWQIVIFLQKFGIGVSNAKKVYQTLGINAISEIESNPYLLLDIARGADFKHIDKIAIDLGIPKNDTKRIKMGIKYGLTVAGYNGHCCTLKQNLKLYVSELLSVTDEEIENSIIDLKVKEDIYIEKRENDEEWIYLKPYYIAEKNVADKIRILQNAKNVKKIENFEKELLNIENSSDIILSDKQKEALEEINESNICIITGGPGTGKTTIIKSIIEMYKQRGKKVVLCAPTGRAAKRMTETTRQEAKTLHRLLEIGKIEDDSKNFSTDYDVTLIDGDVIVVDEMSMVDIFLMNYLLKGIFQGTKLVLVGDADQLPSVGPGNVLKDLIESGKVKTVHLDKIFRQAAKSQIIVNSHKVNKGESFTIKKEADNSSKGDFFYINESNNDKILYNVLSLAKDRLKNYGNYDFFENMQVLTPTKKGILGTKELNKALQKVLNPSSQLKNEKKYSDVVFREGDRVMQVKNNYDIYWEKRQNEKEYGSGVFNGELGTIEKIDDQEKKIRIKFDDDKIAWYDFQNLEELEHSYSITIHKAQRK